MQRALTRDQAASNAQETARRRQSARPSGAQGALDTALPLWSEVQAALGNEAAEGLREGRAESGDQLYLLDLMRASAETGHDFRAYLPWHASLTWNTFARAWYRVIWTERERLGPAPSTGAALDLDTSVESSVTNSALEAELDAGWLDAALLDGGFANTSFRDVSFPDAGAGTFDTSVLDTLTGGFAGGSEGGVESGLDSDLDEGQIAAATARSGAPNMTDPGDMDRWTAQLRASSGAGRPLDGDERAFLAEVFGRPAPDARLHEGSVARQASGEINARAFTIGDHVWFAESPALTSPAGAELLAHEITHVIQNSLGKDAQQTDAVSSPGQPLEIEAENRGREARRVQSEWRVEAPGAVDGAGRFLVGRLEAQLPAEVTAAPATLVREGLRQLLAGRANGWIADHAARLDELAAAGGSAAAVDLARTLLEEARAALSGGATAETLATLVRLGGVPSAEELASFADTFAPYPDFAAQAAGLLAELPAHEDAGRATPLGAALDEDADRTALTRQLVNQLVATLRLPAGGVAVHTDADAADKLAGLGTRGLAEGSDVYLDPAAYDPTSVDGRELLAHEVVHVAQADLPAFDAANAGAFAEAEAHLAADRFAAGGAMQPLEMGLPEGHVAAEGDVSGADLKALLAQHKAMNEQRGGGFVPATGSASKPKADGTEDHGKKVDQYEDGVDGIAGLIEDLSAFDELCDAVDDEEESKAATALSRVKQSEPYQQLCQMWQGAKEGGQDEGAMKARFEEEFNNRGFWGSTEEAFRRVRDGAKRDAKPDAAAAQAKADMAAAANKTAPEGTTTEGDDKGGKNGDAKTDGTGRGNADGAGGAFAGMSVDQMAPTLPAFEELKALGDDPLAQAVYERNHQMGLSQSVASGQTEYGRTGQILSELGNGFGGSFIKGFTDQAIDTLVLDTLGNLADKGLTVASKGAFKTPFVGPLIGLVQNNPLSDEYWSGLFGSEPGKEGKFVKGWDGFASAFDWSQFEGLSGSDWVGVFCAKLADFFGGLRDTLDGIAQLCGTLSAVSYVAGGILIAVGLALVWFFGVGAPLISIGGWLVRAGGILARINTALGMVVMALSLLTTVFRTAAAFLVPAELYAQQLAGVGDAASNYGEKVGAKMADNGANALKDKAGTAYDNHKAKADAKDGDGQGAGKTQGDKAVQDIKDNNDTLDKQNKDLQDLNADAKKDAAKKAEEDAAKKKDDPDAKKDDGAKAKAKAVAKVLFKDVFAPVKGIKETVAGLREMKGLLTKPKTAAAEGARATHEALESALQKRLTKAKAHAAELTSTLNDLTKNAERLKDDPETMAEFKKVIDETDADLKKVQKDVDEWDREYKKYRESVSKTKNADAVDAQKKANEHDDPEAAKAERDKKKKELKELEAQKKSLDASVRRDKEELSAARLKADADAKAKQETDGSLSKEKEHLDGFKKANEAQSETKRLEEQQKTLKSEAEALKKEADHIETKAKLEKEVQTLDEQLNFDRKMNELHMSTLDRWVGRRTDVDTGNGRFRAEITKVDADGVTVDGPNGPVKVPYAQVKDKYVRETGAKMAKARADIQAKETRQREAGLSLQYDYDTVKPGDPAKLRETATAKVKQADELEPQIETTRKKGTYNGSKETEATHADRATNLEATAKKRQESATKSTDEVTRLEKSLAQHDAEQKAKVQTIADTKAKIDELQKSQDLKTQEGYGETTGKMRGASSGNATGGVGSSWGDVFKGTWEALSKARAASRLKAEGKPVPADLEAPSTSAGDALQKMTGIRQSTEEEAKKIGSKQAQLEGLMGLSLTVDIPAMMEAKEKAVAAAKVHAEKHAWAYACFHAEQQVGLLATETETLAKAGAPVKKISVGQKPGIDKAKADESQRAQTLSGAKGDVQKPDSALTGIVVDLVKAISKHGDRFDDKPDGGSSDAGATATKAQDTASTQAKDQKAASTGASDEQKAALETALQLRAKQEGKLTTDIASLDQKHADELVIKGEIQQIKGKAISEREAAKTETETNAAKYNADYKTFTAWATDYKAKREKLGG
ncbi:MAG: DUF4157 domain-containing protein [Myxococcota bacterium]